MEERIEIKIEKGHWVVMDYVVKLKTGKVIDSSEKAGGPVAFVCGEGDFPEPVENGIIGLAPGDTSLIPVPPQYTYGLYDPKKVCLVATERITEPVEIGKVVKAPDEFGIKRPAVVRAVWDGAIMLDFNHPLAGQVLHFEVYIKEVRSSQPEIKQIPAQEVPENGAHTTTELGGMS
ncbi:FKBP-type peptidyl-prolyl cis-trans isomerase SlyD [Dissulfuribacter thermophilus]|uniref:Peptidyl-prolyl cis-trans isomerase n=1 Tax=Dissulfuribacter thermophilus TaxID=1156395 RepID=A0A1B9F779_9BACT|nr:FKBP-type peptidyl-prolyl cis-trans isomerase [Dissulfuribacter thermophilus]OCC15750.1 FKBP-type peptidyl-prolyl cis-trans isomerase SlyD [Dissulfuribacter thermophilus]